MTEVSVEKRGSNWKRWAVGTVVGLAVVIVALQILENGGLSDVLAEVPPEVAYLLCFVFVWFDGVIPIFPGETTLSATSTMAAAGALQLGYVMLAGALGAIVGDSSLFWIARSKSDEWRPKVDEALKNPKIKIAWDSLHRSTGLMIVVGRFVPGMRFAVDASMGLSDIPYRVFLPWSILGGTLWAVYTCALAYAVATTLAGYPLASMIISGLITTLAIVAVFFVDRRRRRKAAGSERDADSDAGLATDAASGLR
jgi:membrane protein DedA with SNARE-associated domain